MNKRFISFALIAIVAVISAFSSVAQTRIDRIVKELEKDPSVMVTYTERRDPKTKKLERQSIILNGQNKKQCERLWEAFEQERTNSVSVTKTRNQSFVMKFQDRKVNSSYVLSINGSTWSLVITKRDSDASDSDLSMSGSCDDALASLDGLDRMDALDALDGLDALGRLDGLSVLNDLDSKIVSGNVTVYDSNGNVIFSRNADNKSDKKTKAKRRSKSRSKSTSKTVNIRSGSKVTVTTENGKTAAEVYYM